MELKDSIRINAPREDVFAALNDPDVLMRAIPGCRELEKVSDTEFTATVVVKVGPVKATFKGEVTLSDINPPESYTISGQGKGGTAGFAKGGATIRLIEDGEGTVMNYEVTADVGGKLAQLGGRLIEGSAKRLSRQFFENFEEIVAAPPDAADAAAREQARAEAAESERRRVRPLVWVAGFVLAGVVIYLISTAM